MANMMSITHMNRNKHGSHTLYMVLGPKSLESHQVLNQDLSIGYGAKGLDGSHTRSSS